jgi:LPXTG-site transpeptidase (sortase) family protein
MKKLATITAILALTLSISVNALATDYYKSTDYADIYAAEYNYGGVNVIDFENRVELPGLFMPTPQISVTDYTQEENFVVTTRAFTAASSLVREDGSIGTLEIPSLKISIKAYEGTNSESMAKGVGHFAETSAWDGNVCLAGHNRGARYTIGAIKDLNVGDIIKYTTSLGTRTYAVSFVQTISSENWANTFETSDNRVTLFTCLANQPNFRVCVQAVEVK